MSEQSEPEDSKLEEEPPLAKLSIISRIGKATRTWGNEMGRDTWITLKIVFVLLIVCGIIYPTILFAVGQFAFPSQANGSLITNKQGHVIGSKLLGQQFTEPGYFHGRPSVVEYNASNSGGSNIGPTNPQLINGNGSQITVVDGTPIPTNGTPVPGKKNTYYVPGSYLGIKTYAQQFRQENDLPSNTPLPVDIITASGSGLDPEISVEAALLQVNRIVTIRQAAGGTNAIITSKGVRELIQQNTQGRDLGVLGEPGVNVLTLNIALDTLYGTLPTK